MIELALASLLFAAAPASLPPDASARDQAEACRAVGLTRTQDRPASPRARRLGDLPPGLLQRTVLRSIGACSVIEARVEGRSYYLPAGPGTLMPLTPAGEPGRRR
jgi:hypothetical protein